LEGPDPRDPGLFRIRRQKLEKSLSPVSNPAHPVRGVNIGGMNNGHGAAAGQTANRREKCVSW